MAIQYGTSTDITITVNSGTTLTAAAARASTAVISGTTNNTTDYLVQVSVPAPATTSGNKQVVVYGYMSTDGTTYTGNSATADNITGSDAAAAIGSPTNLFFMGTIQLNTVSVTATEQFSVATTFGTVPPIWGIVLVNDCGSTITGTVTAKYREVYYS